MWKCKFDEIWLFNQDFVALLSPLQDNAYETLHTLCKMFSKLTKIEIKAVEFHMQSEKTKKTANKVINKCQFCSTLVSTMRQKGHLLCYNKHLGKIVPNPK